MVVASCRAMGCTLVAMPSRNNSMRSESGTLPHERCAILDLERVADNSDGVVAEMKGRRSSPVAGLMFWRTPLMILTPPPFR